MYIPIIVLFLDTVKTCFTLNKERNLCGGLNFKRFEMIQAKANQICSINNEGKIYERFQDT